MIKYIRQFLGCVPLFIKYMPLFHKYAKKGDKYPFEERWQACRTLLFKANKRSFHIIPVISGQDDLPKGQVMFTPNHVSNGDPLALIPLSDRPIAFIAKEETSKMPLVGDAIKSCEGIFLKRGNLRSEIKAFKELDNKMEKYNELSYVIFPEGTRAKAPDFKLGTFHPGSFNIAMKRKVPICPVAIYFSKRVLDQKYHYHKYPIQFRFLKAIMPNDYENFSTTQVANFVHDEIEKNLDEMKKLDYDLVKKFNHYSDKKMKKVFLKN